MKIINYNINKLMSSDLQIAFYKSNKNLRFRSKIIVLKKSQLLNTRNNAFVYSTNFQISFSDVEIILLLNLFIKIIILNSFSKKENFKMKSMIIV